ncbi:MAG TPA: TonB-dependent receptor [Steroidobacteraceae bacterium]|nr:TonB-dependent receptor [Steroidobacteraceae bacterium]
MTWVARLLAIPGSILFIDVASAQQAPAGPVVEEVTVTARRVQENLQDIPIAVSAYTASDIAERNIFNVGDAANYTPDFLANAGPTGGNDGFFFIRGVGQTDLNPATDPGVATYVDGIYLGSVIGASADTLDISRIEVLRGPQGTFFGRNTVGGAVSLTTADPSGRLGGDLEAWGGNRDLKRAQFSLDVPVTDTFGVLLSGLYRGQNGWVTQPETGVTFGDTIARVGRVKLKWAPSQDFSATVLLEKQSITGTSAANSLIAYNAVANQLIPGLPVGFTPLTVPLNPVIGNYVVQSGTSAMYSDSSNVNPELNLDISTAALTLDGKVGDLDLKSITAYRSFQHFSQGDFDGSPYSFYDQSFTTREHQISEELQAGQRGNAGNWLAGLFFYKQDSYHNNKIDLGGNNGCAFIPFPGATFCPVPAYQTPYLSRAITNNQQIDVNDRSYAAYANGTLKFSEQFSASAGVRYTSERKIQDYNFFIDNTADVYTLAGFPPIILPTLSPDNPQVGVPTSYEKTWSEVTPSAGLNYQFDPDLLGYFTYARGFKSGGFNGRPAPNAQGQFGAITPYDPEKLDSYELGLKSEWFDKRLRVNVAAFYSNYKDIQLLVLDNSTGFFNTVNAARDVIKGVELELAARPAGGLGIQASAGWMNNEYKDLSQAALSSGIAYGYKLPLTPNFNGSVGLSYMWRIGAGSLTARADYSYRSEVYFQAQNTADSRQGGYGLLNARLSYDVNDSWQVSAYGRNLTDKIYITNAQDVVAQLGVAFASVGARHEWGGELVYRFGSRTGH